MNKISVFLLTMSVSATGCVSSANIVSGAVSPHQVASFVDGSLVSVRGFLVFDSHARQLWSSRRDERNNNIQNCITLVNTGQYQQLLSNYSRSYVTISGRMAADVTTGYFDVGACGQTGLLVESVVR